MSSIRINIETLGTEASATKVNKLRGELTKMGLPLKGIGESARGMSLKFNKAIGSLENFRKSANFSNIQKHMAGLGLEVNKLSQNANGLSLSFKKIKDASPSKPLQNMSKSAKDSSFSMLHMIRRSVSLVAVLGLVFKAVELVQAGFRKAFDAVEKYTKQVAGLTAVTLSFLKPRPGEGLGDQYLRARDYARGLYTVIQDIAAQTLLTGEQAALMARTFLENGVAIDFNNKQQVQGLKSIANALAIVTEGQAKERQIRSEINNLLKGQIRPTEALGTLLKNIDPQIKEHLKTWKQQGTVIENVTALLKGFDATTGDIAVTWEAISTTLSTTADRVLRGAFAPIYADILRITQNLNAWLEKNRDILQLQMINAYHTIKNVLSGTVSVLSEVWNILSQVVTYAKEWAFWLDRGLKNIGAWLDNTALGKWVNGLKEARQETENINASIVDRRLSVQLTEMGLSYGRIGESLANIPKKIKESATTEQIKTLIDEGFTSGILSASEAVAIMAQRINRGTDSTNKLVDAAKKAGVTFSSLDITRILNDIPQLSDVSSKTFGDVAKGINSVFTIVDGKLKRTFTLSPEFAKQLRVEFNQAEAEVDKGLERLRDKFHNLLERIQLRNLPGYERILEQGNRDRVDLTKAWLELPQSDRNMYAKQYGEAIENIGDTVATKRSNLISNLEREKEKLANSISVISLTGLDKEKSEIDKKFESQTLSLEKWLQDVKTKFGDSRPDIVNAAVAWVKEETIIVETEKQKQIGILTKYYSQLQSLQSNATIGDSLSKEVSLQQEINQLNFDYAAINQTGLTQAKLKRDINLNALQLTKTNLEKESELDATKKASNDLLIGSLERQKELTEELYEKEAERIEQMSEGVSAFKLGMEEILLSWQDTNRQMYDLGQNTLQSAQGALSSFFKDAMTNSLKDWREYVSQFLSDIATQIAENLTKQGISYLATQLGFGEADKFGKGKRGTSENVMMAASGSFKLSVDNFNLAVGRFATVVATSGGGGGGEFTGAGSLNYGGGNSGQSAVDTGASLVGQYGGTYGGYFSTAYSLYRQYEASRHKGGLILHDGGRVPWPMADSSAGLASDERRTVLQTNERVLSREQNQLFMGLISDISDMKKQQSSSEVNVVNVYDESLMGRYATSSRGKKVVKNIMRG